MLLRSLTRLTVITGIIGLSATLASGEASAETLNEALARAYSNNPTINAERSRTRSADELVAIAKSGYRPSISASANIGVRWQHNNINNDRAFGTSDSELYPGGFGINLSQTLFDGFRTLNDVSSAKSQVMAAREGLRNIEQNILFDAAAAYMDVLRDRRIVEVRRRSLEFLNELVRAERTRFEVGESTRTDVAQAEARLADTQALLTRAQANLRSSEAVYKQLIGNEPGQLVEPRDISARFPSSMDAAFGIAFSQHPSILARKHIVDQAMYSVKSAEGALLPSVSLGVGADRSYNFGSSGSSNSEPSASITANLSVPIYQGGRAAASVRQSKENLGTARIEVDISVDQVEAALVSAYSQYQAAKSNVRALEAGLAASRLALEGATEERRVGQRTALDVLNTEQTVLSNEVALAEAERNVIVASYAILSAIGKLSARELGLQVAAYDPTEHYLLVKDKWYGLRTPDGR